LAPRRGPIEHGLHVLERERPADAVEQFVEYPPMAGLRCQGGRKRERGLVEKEACQLAKVCAESPRIARVRRFQKIAAGIRIAQVDIAAKELVVSDFGCRNQPDFPVGAGWSAPVEPWPGCGTHVALAREIDARRLEEHLLALPQANVLIDDLRVAPGATLGDGDGAQKDRTWRLRADVLAGCGDKPPGTHLPGAELRMAQNDFTAAGSAGIGAFIGEPDSQAVATRLLQN
jgi:hypothetical protein